MVRMFTLALVFPSPIAIASLAWDENMQSFWYSEDDEKGKFGPPSNTGGHILDTFNAHDWN